MTVLSRRSRRAAASTYGGVCSAVLAALLTCGACSSSSEGGATPGLVTPDAGNTVTLDGAISSPGDGSVVPPGPACGDPSAKPGFTTGHEVTWAGGGKGTYSLFLGDAYDGHTLLPVIFAFHGDGGDGQSMRGAKLEEASGGAAIIVYPNGPNQTWDLETAPAQNKDYRFFEAMVADVKATLCAQPARVFAFGMSRGAFFANQLGCFESDLLKATSSNSGGGPYSNNGSDFDDNGYFKCPKPAVGALVIHGDADSVVPYSAGVKARDHWRLRNGCGTTTKAWAPSPCVMYDGCPAGHDVGWCSIPGMDHQLWSSAGPAVWKFFSSLP
ncbi:MAG: hypothetical protein JWP97_1425 [Labilithrix sp.]|nr:hypothetical protein [Labilithrix sp.]